jgi:hypothetical protein
MSLPASSSAQAEPSPAASSSEPLGLPEQARAGEKNENCIVVSIDSTGSIVIAASSTGSSALVEAAPALRYDVDCSPFSELVTCGTLLTTPQRRGRLTYLFVDEADT